MMLIFVSSFGRRGNSTSSKLVNVNGYVQIVYIHNTLFKHCLLCSYPKLMSVEYELISFLQLLS